MPWDQYSVPQGQRCGLSAVQSRRQSEADGVILSEHCGDIPSEITHQRLYLCKYVFIFLVPKKGKHKK